MKKNKCNKEDLYKNLDITNSWINNSDNKASIMIAFLGFSLFELCKNTNYINCIINILQKCISNINFSDCLFILFMGISFVFIILGLYKLLKVLIPSLKNNKTLPESLIYYGYISSIEQSDYRKMVKEATEEKVINDLINQNYINSKICFKKFNNFKYGTFFIFLGIVTNIIMVMLGTIIYK